MGGLAAEKRERPEGKKTTPPPELSIHEKKKGGAGVFF